MMLEKNHQSGSHGISLVILSRVRGPRTLFHRTCVGYLLFLNQSQSTASHALTHPRKLTAQHLWQRLHLQVFPWQRMRCSKRDVVHKPENENGRAAVESKNFAPADTDCHSRLCHALMPVVSGITSYAWR